MKEKNGKIKSNDENGGGESGVMDFSNLCLKLAFQKERLKRD
jgi:hypothetical protein